MNTVHKSYRFMREHAGSRVGHNAEDALDLARAESLLEQAVELGVATLDWTDDDLPYEHGVFSDEEIREKFDSNEWTGPFVATLTLNGEIVGSLSGIVVGQANLNDPYCRVVAAGLAHEATSALASAVVAKVADERRCLCPGDCNCRHQGAPFHRFNYCGCRQH